MMKYLTGHDILEGQYIISDKGYILSAALKIPLSTFKSQGYKKVTLRTKHGRKQFKLHRLVAESFLEKPDDTEKNYVHHKDFSRDNNNVSNLEWVTREENIALGGPGTESFGPDTTDGICKYGQPPCGEDNINAKFTNEQVHELCKKLVSGEYKYYRDILESMGLEPTRANKFLLSRIKHGRDWKQISSQYGIKPNHDIVRKRTYGKEPRININNAGEYITPPWSIKPKSTPVPWNIVL